MLSLVRSDLYRLLRSKMIYAALGFLVLYFAVNTWSLSGWEQPDNIARIKHELAAQQVDPDVASRWTNEDLYSFETRTFESYTSSNIMGIAPGGLLGIVLCTLTALFCCQDFRNGFIKNQLTILAGHRAAGGRVPAGRGAYYAGKLITIALVDALFLLTTMALGFASYAIAGFTVRNPEPAWQIAVWALLTWLVLCGYTFATAALTLAIRNQAFSVIAALAVGSQAFESAVGLVFEAIRQQLPGTGLAAVAGTANTWLPAMSTNILLDGAPALFGSTTGTNGFWEATLQALSSTAHPLAHVIATAFGFLTFTLAAVFIGCRRKDAA